MAGHRIKQYSGEEMTHERVVRYIRRTYPGVIFRTDFAAGIKMTIGMASKHKRLQYRRAFPDIFIYSGAMRPSVLGELQYFGLGLELKAANVKLKKRDGSWASDHLAEQAAMMKELEAAGYMCTFACGYEEAIAVIDFYLAGDRAVIFNDFIPQIMDVEVTSDNEDPF